MTREQLIHLLTEAAELEHNLLCSYLYAAFSLRRGSAEGLSESEDGAVRRWRQAVRGVALQEMAHLAIVNNLLVAVGGDCHFQRPNLPVAPGYHPAGFNIRLSRFDRPTLEHFIFLERPDASGVREPGRFQRESAPRTASRRREWITPMAEDYETIGEFYGAIAEGIRSFGAAHGERAFVANGRQVSSDDIGLPGVEAITGAASALAALERVVEEGEGASAHSADCHFARFCAIRDEWSRLERANPGFDPAHAAAADPVMRRPVDADARTWITHPDTVRWLDLGNGVYGALLLVLARLYQPVGSAERKRLMGAAVKAMHALGAIGEKLARLPAQEGASARAGLTFSVPRNIGGRASAGILAERLEALADKYEGLTADNPLREATKLLRA